MNTVVEGCRLCLDPSVEISTTIDSPALKDQMKKVFCFSVEPKQGYCSGVCQSCSFTISEFYEYSEKVHQNQELLNGNVTNCDRTNDGNIPLEYVKQKLLNDFEHPETIENAHMPDNEVSEADEAPIRDSKILLESVKHESLNDFGLSATIEDTHVVSEAQEAPILSSKISQKIEKFQTPSDSEMIKKNQGACELKYEVSELVEEEVQTLRSEITLEEFKMEIADSGLPETIHDEKEIQILDSNITFESGKIKTPSESELSKATKQIINETQSQKEEDELFKKHISLVCELCGKLTDSYSALCSHFKEEHKQRYSYVMCCNKKLLYRSHIREHISFHLNPDIFRCEVCGFRFNRRHSLKKHKLKLHPQTHKCDHCSQSFAEKSALTEHIEWHMKWKCPKCNVLCTEKTFHNHIFRKHDDQKLKMTCNVCAKEFSTIKYFDMHIKKHIGIDVQKFKCKICQVGFKMEKSLNDHMKKLHTTEIQCDLCPRKLKHRRAFNSHKLWWHSEPKHECEYCGKKFKEPQKLREHRAATHTGEVLYTCEYCGKSTNSRAGINGHMQRHHAAEVAQKKRMETKRVDPTAVGFPLTET